MKETLFLFFGAALFWSACQNDNTASVQEIRSSEGSNSAIVRNPVSADQPLDTNKLARITFPEPEHDFGTVKQGAVVTHTFNFVNTGSVPLTILNARSSCGCTIPEWPEDPVPPGGTGEIVAKFDTQGKSRTQNKFIVITANTYPNETKVVLKGFVEAEE